jgi:hypothetical protein
VLVLQEIEELHRPAGALSVLAQPYYYEHRLAPLLIDLVRRMVDYRRLARLVDDRRLV